MLNWTHYESLLKACLSKAESTVEAGMAFVGQVMPALEALPEGQATTDVINILHGIMAVAQPSAEVVATVGQATGMTGSQAVSLAVHLAGTIPAAQPVLAKIAAVADPLSDIMRAGAGFVDTVKSDLEK